jgi:tRNA pseudouridine55 synthase
MLKYIMKKIINIYKPIGLTPIQLIQEFRTAYADYQNIKIAYAGRLDPLAHGVMLLMIGDETKERSKYLGLPKEYEFQILFGVKTDTYDALGLFEEKILHKLPDNFREKIMKFVNEKVGKHSQSYPPYSSKEVNGIPLYQWARDNKLHEIEIPTKEIEIYNFEFISLEEISVQKLKEIIINNIQSVNGNFRQNEILNLWTKFFNKNKTEFLSVGKFKISCSSGTYVRSIANDLGNDLGSGAIALDILRTRVGKHSLKDSIK